MRPCTQPAQRSTTRRERDEELGRAGVLCVAATRLDPVLREVLVRAEELVRQLILSSFSTATFLVDAAFLQPVSLARSRLASMQYTANFVWCEPLCSSRKAAAGCGWLRAAGARVA